jgi:hypothetical protein
VAPFAVTFRDFEAVGDAIDGNDSVAISVDTSAGGPPPFPRALCTVTGAAPECDAPAAFTIPENVNYIFVVIAQNLEGGERVSFSYRLTP